MPQIISPTDARNNFAEIMNQVIYAGEEFLVTRKGKPPVKIALDQNGRIAGKQKKIAKIDPGTTFLLKLTTYNMRAKLGMPRDLAQNHDKYTWE